MPDPIRIFFSWQSDVARNATTRAIRLAISRAVASITETHELKIIEDEATRDVAGSPYIPGKLAEKILKSDIFIGDITSIAVSAKNKSLPNPNVSFELGLAAAHLGWDRIVLLFNEKIAEFSNLPFDFDRHRISTYKLSDTWNSKSESQKNFDNLIRTAIITIIDKDPLRPRELEGKSDEEVRYERDVENLKWFFRNMSVDLMGAHAQNMPDKLHYYGPYMHDHLNSVVTNPSFRLYDRKLEEKLRKLVQKLQKTLNYDIFYRELNVSWVQAFGKGPPHADYEAEQKAATKIHKAAVSLAKNLDQVVEIVRNRYISVDLDELSRNFSIGYYEAINPKN